MLCTSATSYQDRANMLRTGQLRGCCGCLLYTCCGIRRKAFLLRPQVINIHFVLLTHDRHILSERSLSLHP